MKKTLFTIDFWYFYFHSDVTFVKVSAIGHASSEPLQGVAWLNYPIF